MYYRFRLRRIGGTFTHKHTPDPEFLLKAGPVLVTSDDLCNSVCIITYSRFSAPRILNIQLFRHNIKTVMGAYGVNKEYILGKVSPYLTAQRQLREQDFNQLFAILSRKQQYQVVDILIEAGIDLTHEDVAIPASVELDLRGSEKLAPLFDARKLAKLTNEQLCVLFQQGNEIALDVLILKNTKLVWSRALRFSGRYKHKLDDEDLYQDGLLGFIQAVSRFDVKMDNKLTTYAIYWIDQKISRSIADNGFTIRLPVHYFELANYVMRLFFHNPGLSRSQIAEIAAEEKGLTPTQFAQIMVTIENIMSLTSLNTFIGVEQDSELGDFIEDYSVPTVEEQVETILLKEAITTALITLTDRERRILELRFGLHGRRKTLEQVGVKFGVTRERIRQIESKALRKLRHPSRSKILRDYFKGG